MALKNTDEKKLELIAYLIVGSLCAVILGVVSYFDLQSEEAVSPIVYGGLTAAILRVAVKGFNIASYLGLDQIEIKKKDSKDKEK